jgi:peptide/nickel transport system permease protein
VSTSLFINAIPYYLLALLAYLYLVQAWGIFPETGYFSPFEYGPAKFVAGMLLPWIMIGIAYSTQYARFSRGP